VQDRARRTGATTRAGDPFLAEVHDATVTLLYRLLFLLYAEALDLLPVRTPAYQAISLRRLTEEVARAAGDDAGAAEERLEHAYRPGDTGLYGRLGALFRVLDEGSTDHHVPRYPGGLFRTAPPADDRGRVAAAGRFLTGHRVPDFYLARALDLLTRGADAQTGALAFLDYRSLGVRLLGSIYEGLLTYHVAIPDDRERRVALVPSNPERKSSGSYFTPPHLVRYIVANTVGPLLEEKLAAAREAPWDDERAVWDLFDIKVLDPAMGSGHFLVETVNFITDRVLRFLDDFPHNPVRALLERRVRRQTPEGPDEQGVTGNGDRRTVANLVRRLVLKRCVYGVDLNPMAVELAKMSLWLDGFAVGAPLPFLDHHLKCGNALLGATVEDLRGLMPSLPMRPVEAATRAGDTIAKLADARAAEAARSAAAHESVLGKVRGYRQLLNGLVAEHFGIDGGRRLAASRKLIDECTGRLREERLTARDRQALHRSDEAARQRAFFHWDIDFPDVFFDPGRPPDQRRFDAVVGNPPYGYRALAKEEQVATEASLGVAESENVVEHFVVRALGLTGRRSRCGLVLPKQLAYAVTWGRLRDKLLDRARLCGLVDVNEAFEEVLLEQVVVLLGPKRRGSYGVPVSRYSPDGLVPVGELPSSRCSSRLLPLYCTGSAGDLVARVLRRATSVQECYAIVNGSKNVKGMIGDHDGHPCLVGDNVGRYELVAPVLRIRSAALRPEARARLCRPKVLCQKVIAHLTNPIPYVRIAALWDPSDAAVFETAIAFLPRTEAEAPTRMLALLALLNASLTGWFVQEYLYSRSVRTMHFTEDYAGMVPLPRSWAGGRGSGMEELAEAAREASALGEAKRQLHRELMTTLCGFLRADASGEFSGKTKLHNVDYLGWEGRFGSPLSVEDVALRDPGPHDIPWALIARVYPSYPLPGIDAAAWEAAAWEELSDLLRANRGKIGDARVRADLAGRGAAAGPTGPLRRLRDAFLDYHRKVRANRARAAELDFLIDRIVFRLFELAPEEQRLILSRVGPGRPLPPRRGKRSVAPEQ
jgi:hypothetical protein